VPVNAVAASGAPDTADGRIVLRAGGGYIEARVAALRSPTP
jgi:hypothetical protein